MELRAEMEWRREVGGKKSLIKGRGGETLKKNKKGGYRFHPLQGKA